MPDDRCAFAACPDAGSRRVSVAVAQAAQWALVPALLAQVDREVMTSGPAYVVGLMMCDAHAEGIAPRLPADGRPERERLLLEYLLGQHAVGGATVERIADRFGWRMGPTGYVVKQLERRGEVRRARQRGVTKNGRSAVRYLAVHEAVTRAVQPLLGEAFTQEGAGNDGGLVR